MTKKSEDLLTAYKKEKDPKVKTRIHAVLLFLEDDMEVPDVADIMVPACARTSTGLDCGPVKEKKLVIV